MTDAQEIQGKVKTFILREFLDGEDPSALTPTTQMFTTGILDSIATLKLVLFLEERWRVKLSAHEVSPDNLDTIALVADLVRSKQA